MLEALWHAIRQGGCEAQRRVDETHPLDIYADYRLPDRPGLMLVTAQRPPDHYAPKAISLEAGHRADGRWSLRMTLEVPTLLPVFRELCRDVVEATRTGVADRHAASAFLDRLERWRRLLEKGSDGLSTEEARGLIGELAVLRAVILPCLPPAEAVGTWTGPLGLPQDFLLPDGTHLEVKAVGRHADSVRISSLAQLDPGPDTLRLLTVGMERTGVQATGAVTVASLAENIRVALDPSPSAVADFDNLLAFAGWSRDRDSEPHAVRLGLISAHEVDEGFPRLTPATVPDGILEASYLVRLPQPSETWDPHQWTSQTSTQT